MIDRNNVSWYIAESLRTNDKLDVLIVMPFIQFCLKSLNENRVEITRISPFSIDTEWVNSRENLDLRMQFLTLKNSLTIMNHFRPNGTKEAY